MFTKSKVGSYMMIQIVIATLVEPKFIESIMIDDLQFVKGHSITILVRRLGLRAQFVILSQKLSPKPPNIFMIPSSYSL